MWKERPTGRAESIPFEEDFCRNKAEELFEFVERMAVGEGGDSASKWTDGETFGDADWDDGISFSSESSDISQLSSTFTNPNIPVSSKISSPPATR